MVTYDCVIPIKTILAPKGKGFGTKVTELAYKLERSNIGHESRFFSPHMELIAKSKEHKY